jgi:ubiquinone/menaquinone biosynthesis C-methylase UbiE
MSIVIVLFIGLLAVLIISLLWRIASQRRSLPCPAWLSWLVELDNPFAKAHRADIIVENLQLAHGMKVIDIGCGPGRVTIPLARKLSSRGEVGALDIQLGMLDKVRKKAEAENIHNIHYINAALEQGVLMHNYYDRALLVAVLGEIPDQKVALKEIFNALKPSGILSVTETIFDPHYQKQKQVSTLARDVGFRVKSVTGNSLAFTMLLEKPNR